MMNIWRNIVGFLDRTIYWFVEILFQIIMDLSNAEIFSQSVINDFARRIYIILGLIMVFKIMISFIQILINPEKMSDKEQGVGNILIRVVKALLLIVFVPMIFKTARLAQNYVIPVIPKVILGVTINPSTDGEASETMASVGRMMAFYSFLPFFNYDNTSCDDGSIYGTGTQLGAQTTVPEIYSVGTAIDHVNDKDCNTTTSKDGYKYNYRWLVSTFVGAYLVYVLVSIAVSIAIRTLKFAICEFAAPIPIASYVDPKTSKQTFDTWVSTTWKVYLDLFIRIIIVYFIIFVFDTIFQPENLSIIYAKLNNDWWRCTLVTLFLIVGLLQFAKSAPKFIGDMLGLKGSGDFMGMFKGEGFKAFKEAAGIPGTVAGAVSSGIINTRQAYANSRAARDPNANWWKKATSGANALRRGAGGVIGATRRGLAATYKGEGWQGAYRRNVDETTGVSLRKVLKSAEARKTKEASILQSRESGEVISDLESQNQSLMAEMNKNGSYSNDVRNAKTKLSQATAKRDAAKAAFDRAQASLQPYINEYNAALEKHNVLKSHDDAKTSVNHWTTERDNALRALRNAQNSGDAARIERARNQFMTADENLNASKSLLTSLESKFGSKYDLTKTAHDAQDEMNAKRKELKKMQDFLGTQQLSAELNIANQEFSVASQETARLNQLKADYEANLKLIDEENANIKSAKDAVIHPTMDTVKSSFAKFVGDSIPRGKDYVDLASHLEGQKKSVLQGEGFKKIEENLSLVMTKLGENNDGVFKYKDKDGHSIKASFEDMLQARQQVAAGKEKVTVAGQELSAAVFNEYFKDAQKTVGEAYVNAVVKGVIENETVKQAQIREKQAILAMNIPNEIKNKYLKQIEENYGGYLKRATDEAEVLRTKGETLMSYERVSDEKK